MYYTVNGEIICTEETVNESDHSQDNVIRSLTADNTEIMTAEAGAAPLEEVSARCLKVSLLSLPQYRWCMILRFAALLAVQQLHEALCCNTSSVENLATDTQHKCEIHGMMNISETQMY